MSTKDRYDLQLRNVVRHLFRSIMDATDEEITEDARLAGVDLQVLAEAMKRQLGDIAKKSRQKKLIAAMEAYESEVAKLTKITFDLPASPAKQRDLLQLIAAQHTASGTGQFTAKFRDFDKLSDSDVASLLEELAALGLIPDNGSKSG